ncbi:hypothetical protein BU26DRAFT_311004 [Trematosphaeria pertusa]|uniref:Uncharacterized protein n=1 Tax=Trematosphaeria pertusa TaxID=390896 RepID=A0A6A6IGM1_9PLEO|nr:uncharacterized protein BU26DRAFT_311004 [Trematosphaeria pertusa]KAF2249042.1 hypothetical protein BU26DRAFT_311004 [Trematosphaeria pertusa]
MELLVLLSLPLLVRATANTPITTTPPPPKYTVPCTMGNDKPCSALQTAGTSWTCTPTMPCVTGKPCGGLCIDIWTPPPVTPCTMGDDRPCLPSSHCTPTMTSAWGHPWKGQCIEGAPTTPPPSSPTIPPPWTPPPVTPCTMGDDKPCEPSSHCTPTMVCTTGLPCGGACIENPPPPCNAVLPTPCPPSSYCSPTSSCSVTGVCMGSCVPSGTPTSPTTSPTGPITKSCNMGDDSPCLPASSCVPTMSCKTNTPCYGVCKEIYGPQTPVIPCTMGVSGACTPPATCTPTMMPTPGVPQLGQCWTPQKPTCLLDAPTPMCQYDSTCSRSYSTCLPSAKCIGRCEPTTTPPISITPSPTPTEITRCNMGDDGPCMPANLCTPTMPCKPHRPCSGTCSDPWTVPPLTTCTMGDDSPCKPIKGTSGHCTPTEYPTPGVTQRGQCIWPQMITCILNRPTPVCGLDSSCSRGYTCFPGATCVGSCVATASPTPTPTEVKKKCWHGRCEHGYNCVDGWCVKGHHW